MGTPETLRRYKLCQLTSVVSISRLVDESVVWLVGTDVYLAADVEQALRWSCEMICALTDKDDGAYQKALGLLAQLGGKT